jgi:hypothetical protein
MTPTNATAQDLHMCSVSSFTVAFLLLGLSVAAVHADGRKLNWNCGVRGFYDFAVDDEGRGTPSGNPLSGVNRLLFAVKMDAGNKGARFVPSAYVDNKLVPQMKPDAKQVIEVEMDDDDAPKSINANWIALSGANSFVIERSLKTWRFVHTTATIFDESVTKSTSSSPGPSVSIETGDCVLNP